MSQPPMPPYGDTPGQPAYPPPYPPPAGQPGQPAYPPAYPPPPTYPAPQQPPAYPPPPTYAPPPPSAPSQPQSPQHLGQPAYPPPPAYPGAEQPQYGQPPAYPGAEQPQYGQPPSYGGPPQLPAPPKKSNTGKIVLIVVSVLVVLCLGLGGVGAYVYVKSGAGDAAKTHLTTPTTLGGRPKVTDPELQDLMSSGISDLKKDLTNPGDTVGALYGDPASLDLLVAVAVQGTVANPDGEIDGAFNQLASDGSATTSNVKSVSAGPLGGAAKCGDITEGDVKLGLCAWADHGSVGAVFIYNKSASALEPDFITMRGQIESRD